MKKIMTRKIGSTRRVFAGLSDQMFVFELRGYGGYYREAVLKRSAYKRRLCGGGAGSGGSFAWAFWWQF